MGFGIFLGVAKLERVAWEQCSEVGTDDGAAKSVRKCVGGGGGGGGGGGPIKTT